MKSLEERKSYRDQQKTDNAKKEAVSPTESTKEGATAANSFNAVSYTSGNVDTVVSGLDKLTVDQLASVEAAEAAGKKRVSVLDAIRNLRIAKGGAAAGWGANV